MQYESSCVHRVRTSPLSCFIILRHGFEAVGHALLASVSTHDYAVVVHCKWIGAERSWYVEGDVLVVPEKKTVDYFRSVALVRVIRYGIQAYNLSSFVDPARTSARKRATARERYRPELALAIL